MTATTAKVIGLWLDRTGEEPRWIVSRDRMNERGEAETTSTVATYAKDDYADALDYAKDLARLGEYCVIQTDEHGAQECIYQVGDAVNPLV